MPYRVQTTVRDSWAPFCVLAILWLIFTVVAWPHVGWILRVVFLFFLLVPFSAVFVSFRPYTTEIVVDDGLISWGKSSDEIIDIKSIRKIVLDEDKGMTLFEIEGQQLLTKLPWIFNSRDLCDYIKRKYPHIKIESKTGWRP